MLGDKCLADRHGLRLEPKWLEPKLLWIYIYIYIYISATVPLWHLWSVYKVLNGSLGMVDLEYLRDPSQDSSHGFLTTRVDFSLVA